MLFYEYVFYPYTHDECQSFKITAGDIGIANTAKDHYLNSWMTLFYPLFSGREIVPRLPAIVGFSSEISYPKTDCPPQK